MLTIVSDELRRRLRMLEEDYERQPIVVQQEDLLEIQQLRAELGMPRVDAKLREIRAEPAADRTVRTPAHAPRDHSDARAIYDAYLAKKAQLAAHRAYAERVVRATAGSGMTPVRPLATMGTGGGPLRCDECGKPIVLEGGRFHGMSADAAWASAPDKAEGWTSFILGGLVVELEVNGTLRIYHGYIGRDARQCCNVASKKAEVARQRFASSTAPRDRLLAFFEDEHPERTKAEREALVSAIVDVMYGYDPGFGVNRPGP